MTEHNHAPDSVTVEVKKLINDMKVKAQESDERPPNILCDVACKCSKSAAGKMSTSNALKKTIHRVRTKENHVPVAPESLQQLALTPTYSCSEKGDNFLLYDSGPAAANDRILVFGTSENLNSTNCKHWFADGTFKSAPHLFTQIYIIHGIVKNQNVLAVYALLPSKTEAVYKKLLAALKVLNPNLNLETIIIGFEKAAMNAFKANFATASVRGFFFHLSQAIWRKIQQLGLQVRYASDGDFALEIRLLAALALMSIDVIFVFRNDFRNDHHSKCHFGPSA
ncbi:hypothetical protein JTE90_004456 [Oedothorax gibbosus]|uniref:MULE transposase domain-containing protein n=1 Tax=Oedothorax gibbosus TaxID=931172 RepID=A0AAV6TK42_9ARAC|nr:hypothetical protein JTE90_004456 [Oedothorax gibbosus]